MHATLTYSNPKEGVHVVFELTRRRTMVGRRPGYDVPTLSEKYNGFEPCSVASDDSLYISVPAEYAMARKHFAIFQTDEAEETAFWADTVDSRGGLFVNDTITSHNTPVRLKSGDIIFRNFRIDMHPETETADLG